MTLFKGFKKDKEAKKAMVKKPSPAVNVDARTMADKQAEAKGAMRKNHKESGGPKGLEPTRYGDWEKSGRCIDF